MSRSRKETSPSGESSRTGVARRWTYAVLLLAVLFVLMPFLFWQATWFGRPLNDEEMGKYLSDMGKPRKIQHALSQIGDRIIGGDPTVRQWYPEVLRLTKHPAAEIRLTVAWVMGQDNNIPEFHNALLALLADSHPMVRRNAALSLVRYGDDAGREELLAMLNPFGVEAPASGIVKHRLRAGDSVNPGTLIGRIEKDGEVAEVRSPVPGTLKRWLVGQNSQVEMGEAVAEVAPSPEMVWEALRALVLVGQPQDLEIVNRYAGKVTGMPDRVAQQAAETARAIRSRFQ
jgi:hypothetical protein